MARRLPVRVTASQPNGASRLPARLLWFIPLGVGAGLRFWRMGELEPFVDEGANILTALHPGVRAAFEPLEQGRPWLMWLFRPAGWWPEHALAVARAMSGLAGLGTVALLGWTLAQLAGRKAGLAGMWAWATLPIAVWHERLALQDPFVTLALAATLALVVQSRREPTRNPLWWMAAAGIAAGCAVLLKISAALAALWLIPTLLAGLGKPPKPREILAALVGFTAPFLTLGGGITQLGANLGRYDALPSFSGGGFAHAAWERAQFWFGAYAGYGGLGLGILLAGAAIVGARARSKLTLVFGAGWLLALLVNPVVFHNSHARYTLPDHLPLVLALGTALGAAQVSFFSLLARSVTLGLGLLFWAQASARIAHGPATAPVPAVDIAQYVTGPWSGRGLGEVRRHLAAVSEKEDVDCLVFTHAYLRPGCYGLLLAALAEPRLAVVPRTIYEPAGLEETRRGLGRFAAGRRVAAFLLYEGNLYPAHPWLDSPGAPVRKEVVFDRGNGETFTLYRINH